MQVLRGRRLAACVVAGLMAIPALASGPPRVAVFDATGTMTTPSQLAYTTVGDQSTYKIAPDLDGAFTLDPAAAGQKIVISLANQDIELNLANQPEDIVVYLGANGALAKFYSATDFSRLVQGASQPIGMPYVAGQAPELAVPRSLLGQNPVAFVGGDDCANAEAIVGVGTFSFDNSAATRDGPNHPACDFFGQAGIDNDVWFCWTSDVDGTVEVATCNGTTVDTKMAVYDGCACPPTDAMLLACNDDSCGLQSLVSFTAVSGQTYLIRIGTFPGATGGTGTFTISAAGPPPGGGDCNEPAANCHAGDISNAFNSNGTNFVTADDFSPAADGSITSICWWGTYFDGAGDCGPGATDNFTVNYYADSAGFPGALIASFSQAGGTLTITRGVTGAQIAGFLPEYEYTGTHAPVAVTGGQCYWIEISNPIAGCSWFWEISTDAANNNRGMQDGDPPDGYTIADVTPNDQAFCISMMLGDDSACLPPEPNTPCTQPAANCQAQDNSNAFNSTAGIFTTADDFQVPAGAGPVSDVCWWGAYFDGVGDCAGSVSNDFTVTYYADAGGIPGAPIASFSQSGGTLMVTGPVATGGQIAGFLPEYEFTATHAPLALNAGDCVWIEIVNDTGGTGCSWFWELAFPGNGLAAQDGGLDGYQVGDRIVGDLAFCLNSGLGDPTQCLPPGPANDDCDGAEAIPCNGSATGDNTFATDLPSDPMFSCKAGGPGNGAGSLWYTFVATDTSAFIDTNASTGATDTLLAVYDGNCGSLVEIGCSEDEGNGLLSEVCVDNLTVGNTYYIQVASFSDASRGSITVTVTCPCPQPMGNDLCVDAIGPLAVPSVTPGTTDGATVDTDAPFCDTSATSPGVWYTVIGTGNTMTASLCNGATAFDSKLTVYCGDCNNLTCVAGNDDFCGLQSEVSWCSEVGATYRILVHGFGGASGPFELTVSDDGVPCTATVQCISTGACCFADGTCDVLTALLCTEAGGEYQGDGTDCGGQFSYVQGTGGAFEDISATGTLLALGDDDGMFVPIGFDFSFFADLKTDVAITSNGYLTFSPDDLTDFSEDPIPNSALPNDIIAVLWDDLNPTDPSASAAIYYETRGTAPNRRFIAQWTDVPEFGGAGANTFQAVLFEGSNCVELRYQTVTTVDFVAGVEDAAGTSGVDVSTDVADGASISLCPQVTESPCAPQCDTCPPGSTPITDAEGDFAGWCVTTSHPAQVDIFVDQVIPGQLALIEVSKDFVDGPGFGNVIPPILMDFVQVCPDELTTPMILIADESITNQTGVDWTDYHWILFDGPESWFDVAASSGFSVAPFSTAQFEDFLDGPMGNKAKKLNAFDGLVPAGANFFAGSGAGELKIGVDLSGPQVSFTLKQRPTIAGTVRLNVDSNNNGVPITLTPADMYGDQSGAANFTRFYADPTAVTLTAPRRFDGRRFRAWEIDGVIHPELGRTIAITAMGATQVRALYGLAPLPADGRTPLGRRP